MGAQPISAIRKYSIQEYLELERKAETKSEYYDGYIVAMSGANPPHNLIMMSLGALIFSHLRGKGCYTYSSDQRVWIDVTNSYVYPDLTVVCGQPEYNQDNPQALLNPTFIVEVLSSSTKDWDTTYKKKLYKRIPSLQEILYIDSTKPYIGGLYRSGENWIDGSEINLPNEKYRLQTLGLDLSLADVYGQVLQDFGPVNPFTIRES